MTKKSKSNFNPSQVRMLEMRVIEGHVECMETFPFDADQSFVSDYDIQILFALEGKQVRTSLKIWIESQASEDQGEAKAYFHFHAYFQVSNLDELLTETSKNENSLDPLLQLSVASLTFSTARGILITRLQGTAFHRYVLPIVAPATLLSPD